LAKKKKRRAKSQGKGKFEALKYVKQLEKKMGSKDEPPKKDDGKPPKEEDKKILDMIKVAENELLTLKEKVDTKKLDRILQEASEAISAGDPKGAMDLVKKLKEEIDKVVENHIEKRFFDAEMLIIELEVVGIDVSSSKKVVEEGKKALKEKQLKVALDLAETAATEVENLQRKQVMEVMTYAKSILDSLRALHVDVGVFDGKIEEATKELDEKHFEKAMELVIMFEGELSSFRVQQFGNMVEKTRVIISEKDAKGRDVSEAERMLKRALQAIDVKDFESASDYLVEARYAADKEAGLEFKAKAGQRKAKERFDELKKEGIFSATAQDHIGKSTKALRKKDFNKALMEAKKAEAAMGIAVREHERILRRINNITHNKEMAEEQGCNLEESAVLLGQARQSLKDGEFDLALDFVTQANEEIHMAMVTKATSDMTELMEAAKTVNDTKADGQLTEAISLVKKGKSAKGFSLIIKVKSRLSGTMEKINQLKDGIVKIQETLEELALKGVDISEPIDIIEEVQKAMSSANFVKARSKFYHCEKIVNQLTADTVYDNLARVERDLGAFERIGIPLPGAYEKLDESWSNLLRGEKERASEITKELNTSLTDYKEEFAKTMEAIQTAQTRVHNATIMGIDVGGATATLTKAFESVSEVDFPKGQELANQTLDGLAPLEEDAVNDIKNSTKIKMEDMESNFPVPLARDRYNRAKALLEVRAFFHAFTELNQAASRLEWLEDKLQNLDTEFEEVDSLLTQGDTMDIDTSAFRNLLDESKANKETGHLDMSLSLLEQVKEDLKEIFDTRVVEKKNSVAELVPVCEERNIDVEGCRIVIKETDELLKIGDYQNAFMKITEVHKELIEYKQQWEESNDAVMALTANIERAEELGLDTAVMKETLGKATSALETGHYTEAMDTALEGDADLTSGLSELVDTRLEDSLDRWIEKAKAFKADTSDIERFKELAIAEKEAENYEGALENLKLGVDKAKDVITVVLEGRIDEPAEEMAQVRKLGIRPGPIEGLLAKASSTLEKAEFEKVTELLDEIKSGLKEQRDRQRVRRRCEGRQCP